MSITVVNTLLAMTTQVLNSFGNTSSYKDVPFVIYLDHFGVESDELTNDHKAVMDGWAAGNRTGGFPFIPDNPNHEIKLIAGMTSQTGPDLYNEELGRRRAEKVYSYLKSRIPASQLKSQVETVGATQPNIDSPGEELGINRAVGVILVVRIELMAIIGVRHTPPPPREDPPAPSSRQWEMAITGSVGVGLDPIPGINILGVLVIVGRLRNVRTQEEKAFKIVVGGLDLSAAISTPIEIAVNTQMEKFGAFNTHWVDFDDFDNTPIFFGSLSATNVMEVSDSSIAFPVLNTQVSPPDLTLKSTAVGVGLQMQFGIMILD